jgi:RimJ/RimL family protein N-acetyltransferase
LNIKRSSIAEEIHQLVTPDEFKTTIESETKWIEKHIENPYYIAIVALLDNQIVGLIDFSNGPKQRISHTGDFGMSVDSSVRGLGIGTILLQLIGPNQQTRLRK